MWGDKCVGAVSYSYIRVQYMLTVDLVDVVPLGTQHVELLGVQAEALILRLLHAHVVLDVAQLALELLYAPLLVLQH